MDREGDEAALGADGEAAEEQIDADLVDVEELTEAEAELDEDADPLIFEGEPSAEPVTLTEPESRYVVGDLEEGEAAEIATGEPRAGASRFVAGEVPLAPGTERPDWDAEG